MGAALLCKDDRQGFQCSSPRWLCCRTVRRVFWDKISDACSGPHCSWSSSMWQPVEEKQQVTPAWVSWAWWKPVWNPCGCWHVLTEAVKLLCIRQASRTRSRKYRRSNLRTPSRAAFHRQFITINNGCRRPTVEVSACCFLENSSLVYYSHSRGKQLMGACLQARYKFESKHRGKFGCKFDSLNISV